MKGPPPVQLRLLVRWLRRVAEVGGRLPSLDGMAEALGVADRSRMTELLRQGEALELFVVIHGRNGIAAIEAADGGWRAERGPPPPPPKRRCLRCRKVFQPEHRHNFLCGCPEVLRLEPRGMHAAHADQRGA